MTTVTYNNATIERETEKAILVNMDAKVQISFWLPKSQIVSISDNSIEAAAWTSKNAIEAMMKKERVAVIVARAYLTDFITVKN